MSITSPLVSYAGLDKECIIIGVNDHLEIWDSKAFEEFMNDNSDIIEDIAENLFDGDKNALQCTKNELLENLDIKDGGIYIDGTIGYAGDSKEILKKIPNGALYGFDTDKKAVEYSTKTLKEIGDNFKIFNTNFVNIKEVLDEENITSVDGIIFDLGFSSPQIDDETRGFSFMHDGPLDMRMSSEGKSAKDIIDTYSENELAEIFFKYGEEKLSKVIAKKIKSKNESIKTTLELVEVIKEATGANYFYKQHPERKIFQALRIEVNEELTVLEKVLPDAIKRLKVGGRMCVITFHSLEDRIVKNVLKIQ